MRARKHDVFEHIIDFPKVNVRVFLERDIQVLIELMMEQSMTVYTQKYRPFEFRAETVSHQINMMQLQLLSASANIAIRTSLHENPFDLFASAPKMTIASFERDFTFFRTPFHGVPPQYQSM